MSCLQKSRGRHGGRPSIVENRPLSPFSGGSGSVPTALVGVLQKARDIVRAKPGDKLIDVGCGPAKMAEWLPGVSYVGIDASERYIESAKTKYGDKGLFLVGDTRTLGNDERLRDADIVLCSALLHHLNDDEALDLMRFAHRALKPNGRLVTGDPCWVPNQGFISRWVVSMDRGKNVRTEEGYRKIAETVFKNVKTTVSLNSLRIPSPGVGMECSK